jgi:DNA polymerase-3 subunit delta'
METWSEMEKIQPLATRIITNSIKKDRVSHAYLLQGARGTGKEAIARLIAKGFFCNEKTGIEACGHCSNCRRIDSGNHPDVHWIEPDGQSIKMDQIKSLQKEFTYSGMESNKKVYIIKGADTLTVNAANRILKFLEEPSKQTIAMMLTENGQAIIPTIRSRCQVIDLKPLQPQTFQQQLMEQGMEKQDAVLISALTNDLNDALKLNESELFAGTRNLVIQLVEVLIKRPKEAYLYIHSDWIPLLKERQEQELGLDLLLLALKDILYMHLEDSKSLVFFTPDNPLLERARMTFTQEQVVQFLRAVFQAKRKLKQNVQPQLVIEQLTLQMQR